jgi:phytanoyl-CoA hydroxylase
VFIVDSVALRACYRRDGVVTVPGIVGRSVIDEARHHLDTLQAGYPSAALLTADIEGDDFFAALVRRPELTVLALLLLEDAPVPFGCTYIVKAERIGLPVLWHQDGHPWQERLGITRALTLWLALDETDPDNGGLRVIPGSHVTAGQPLRPNTVEPNVFGCEIDPALVDESRAVDVRTRLGDLSAHHPNLIHSSPPNRSDRPRRALAVRYRSASSGGSTIRPWAATT